MKTRFTVMTFLFPVATIMLGLVGISQGQSTNLHRFSGIALMRRALVQDLYVVSFFRNYLRDEDDHFIGGQSADWPEVDVFLKNRT